MTVSQPLPESLRPETLAEFVGQTHLKDRILALIEGARLPSLLLFGPPGCGKSTLALLLGKARGGKPLRLSAPEAGLQQLRRLLNGVDILVLDELHRFSKSQQDFFLPLLENGEITMLATTTENPSFSVTRQLLSRLHVMRMKPLTDEELVILGQRGLRKTNSCLEGDVLEFLAANSNGDARTMLNLVEYTLSLPDAKRSLDDVRKTMPDILSRHDKTGDSHYELASALIKSIRGSDPDAALYYLASLLEGGEDPRFICRRLILSASEDIGLGDPNALPLAVACQQAVEFVGMPEGFIPLAETTVYLALAPKSNSTYIAYQNAMREIKSTGVKSVPLHLRNPSTLLHKKWGYGEGYKYPHQFPGAWVEQEYLPPDVVIRKYYQPKDQGDEPRHSAWWKRLPRGSALPRSKNKRDPDD